MKYELLKRTGILRGHRKEGGGKKRSGSISTFVSVHQCCVHREEGEQVQEKGGWCPPVTPSSYLHLLQEFRGLFTSRQAATSAYRKKYLSGLDKLAFAASQVCFLMNLYLMKGWSYACGAWPGILTLCCMLCCYCY